MRTSIAYWSNYVLVSFFIHCLGASGVSYILNNTRSSVTKEKEPILVQLVMEEDPVGFNPDIPLGDEIQTQSQGSVYPSLPEHYRHLENRGYQNRVDNEVNGESSDSEKPREKSLGESFRIIERALESITESLAKIEKTIELKQVLSDGGSLDDHFQHTYKQGDRTEITYYQHFRALCCAYLTFYHDYSDIEHILSPNSHVRRILSMNFEFQEDGKFKIINISHAPGFKDQDKRVLEGYTKYFNNMNNGEFISPSLCGLKSPYTARYTLVNSMYSSSKNIPSGK